MSPIWIDTGWPKAALVILPGQSTDNKARPERSSTALRLTEAQLALPAKDLDRAASGLPLWPADRAGSFSHWQDSSLCLLACGKSHHYGADLEGWADSRTAADIRAEALNTGELARFGAAPEGWAETLIFSAKESFFKAAFPRIGKVFGFEALQLIKTPNLGTLTFALTRDLAAGLNRHSHVTIHYAPMPDAVATWTRLAA